ncbi:MAG: phosphoribosylformylglycinamidine synthase II [Candidatus Marinimicrobia bacterium]|nr:phosphoribosylformylglycinamidine synthase II [Candidatus Neomarinimicrobiota bacterium]|tara:strand:- start:1426 stop:3669 length:2244 start_codon:yes stop_codon:yes gene_type:complete
MNSKSQQYPKIDSQVVKEHGLSTAEYSKIKDILGREPTFVELGIFSVMWSEHCSYKSSIKWLKTFPRSGGRLLVGAGEENAGLVDFTNDLAVCFKIESHNHPSAVEPYEGAATGVGGIMRDIFTMGARPIASMNSLRFGNLETNPRNRFLLEHVVEGISDYGNCLGIPVVGGEVVVEDSYSGNPLVNAMSLGVVNKKNVVSAIAEGEGNPVFIVGSKTGRDGIHGATFASEELSEQTESQRSNVQVGDPFTEKLLLEATLELSKKSWLIGVQDMGAAGITCSCSEMSAKGEVGICIDLDKVPKRELNMNAYEVMLSESQERMLVVIKKGFEEELKQIFLKWELDCTEVGHVTKDQKLIVFDNGNIVASIPSNELVLGGGAPQYDMAYKQPDYISKSNNLNLDKISIPSSFNDVLLQMLSCPNIASKQWIYNQYDSTVRTNTVQGPGGDAGVIRIKGTKKGLAMSTDCNGKYVYLDPYKGGQVAVLESARNVVCSGGKPIAITNCLNFGNPNDPGIYWQFKNAVKGIGDACRQLDTPVTGGNVSFYNETKDGAVYPSPVIGMVGEISNIENYTTIDFKEVGDFIILIGSLSSTLGGSEYLKIIHNKIEGPIANFDINYEIAVQKLCLKAIEKGIVKSAHDISKGGLSINIVESLLNSKDSRIGAKINIDSKLRHDEVLFGECQSAIIITINEQDLLSIVSMAKELNVYTQTIGRVTDDKMLSINDSISLSRSALSQKYFNYYPNILDG